MAYISRSIDKKPDTVRCHKCAAMIPVKDYLKHRETPCKKG